MQILKRPSTLSSPLSFAQQRIWFFDQLEPGSAVYNMPAAIRLSGALDVRALEASINEVIRRHHVLRSRFDVVNGEPCQIVHEAVPLALPMEDLSQTTDSPEKEARRRAEEEARRPFDLSRGPLVRGRLLRLRSDDHVVLLTMHHIVSDGWSIGILVRELSILYHEFLNARPSPLPDLDVQYGDYAYWQRRSLTGPMLDSQLRYWRQRLAGAGPLLALPTDRLRPSAQTYRGSNAVTIVPGDVVQRLKALSRREGVTMYMTLLAAFQALLLRYTGQTDVLVGSPVSGRSWREVRGLIGLFLNTIVIRVDLSGNPCVKTLLGRVREAALGAYAHQDLPFERLVEDLRQARDLSHHPIFQVWFVMHGIVPGTLSLPGLTVTPFPLDGVVTKFDLMLSVEEGPYDWSAALRYSTDLFQPSTIDRMLSHFVRILCSLA
jgi:hypothetical protein